MDFRIFVILNSTCQLYTSKIQELFPMRNIRLFTFLLLSLSVIQLEAAAQKGKPKASVTSPSAADNTVLATIGKEPITYRDLENAFRKNMNRRTARLSDVPKDSVMDFMKLYINYRLKVVDATDRKLDKDSAVTADIAQNRRLLAETFYSDKKIIEPAVEKILERRKREIQVAIIVVAIPEKGDKDAAELRAQNILKLVRGGANFEQFARDSSDDKETGARNGLLPFITGGKIIRPVEDAAYAAKAGEVYPQLVKANGAYFIIKILKNEPRVKVRASHLLFSSISKNDSLGIAKKGDSILAILRTQPNMFEQLVRENSDDKTTKSNNGYMGSYYTRSGGFDALKDQLLLPEFENALFALKDGEISGKVWTDYGLHIIRRDSSIVPNLTEERELVKKDYKKLFYEEEKTAHIDSLKRAYGYKINDAALKSFLTFVDTSKTTMDSSWDKKVTQAVRQLDIYSSPAGNLSVGKLIDTIGKRADFRSTSLNYKGITRVLNKLYDQKVVADATAGLESQYPDFANMMRDFRDGILLFKVEEQEVWGKLKFDSIQARHFFDSTKANYRTDIKYDISEIYVSSDSLAKAIRKRIDKGENFEEIASQLTEREKLREKKGRHGLVSVKENKLAGYPLKMQSKIGDILGPENYERGYSIIKVNDIAQPRQKSFEEAIPDFAPAFQDMVQKRLTEQWLTRIKKTFPVKIDDKKVASIFKK